jgi:hypothetical protein
LGRSRSCLSSTPRWRSPELAGRYGWINRALPAQALDDFVGSLAHLIAQFPTAGMVALKERINAIALAPVEDFRRDYLFGEGARNAEVQSRFQAAFKGGFETRDGEILMLPKPK